MATKLSSLGRWQATTRAKKHVIQASGHTVGSIGLPPSLTLSSGGLSMLSGCTATCQDHLRCHSRRVPSHAATAPEFTILHHLFRVLLLQRLRLPLPPDGETVQCPSRATWVPKSCMLPHRALWSEETCWTTREGDGTCFQRSRSSSQVRTPHQDLPCFGGSQLAIDVTLRSLCGEDRRRSIFGGHHRRRRADSSPRGQGDRVP